MVKTFFEWFEVTEAQLTPGAITRLRVASVFSFLLGPAMFIDIVLNPAPQTVLAWVGLTLLVIGFVSFCIVGMTRILNRQWTPEKFLEEGELSRKREVNNFAFFWLMSVIMVAATVIVISSIFDVRIELLHKPNAALGLLILILFLGMSLQGFKLGQLLTPLDFDGETPEKTMTDRYYNLVAIGFVVLMLGLAFIL